MELIRIEKLKLAPIEKEVLRRACEILNEIACLQDDRPSVPWTHYDQDEIWQACELMESFYLDD